MRSRKRATNELDRVFGAGSLGPEAECVLAGSRIGRVFPPLFGVAARLRLIGDDEMEIPRRSSRGRADPFGLLVVAVLFALTVTIGIQSGFTATAGGAVTTPLTLLTGFASAPANSNG